MKKLKMQATNQVTFEDICNKYLDNCRQRNLREGTINHYRQSYGQFYKFFDKNMPIGDIDEAAYTRYVLHLRATLGNDVSINSYLRDFITLINNLLMSLAEEQIKAAFIQSEKEATDLHTRISQGMRESKKNGTQIGLTKGTTLTTQKSIQCKEIIKKHAVDFGGTLNDKEVMVLCKISRNSYYKYKMELKRQST